MLKHIRHYYQIKTNIIKINLAVAMVETVICRFPHIKCHAVSALFIIS